MTFFGQVGAWFANPASDIPGHVFQHLEYTGLAVLVALVVGLPAGALVGHTGRGGFALIGVGNALRALPTLGLLTIAVLVALNVTGRIGIGPAVIVLAVLGIPPIMAGTYSGIRAVDPMVVDAARGVGMREWQILLNVEVPNALPLIFGGLRASVLQVLSTATVAAYIALGGLGRYLIDGLANGDYAQVTGGAILVAGLAIVVEVVLVGIQWLVVSPGLRPTRRSRARAIAAPAPAGA